MNSAAEASEDSIDEGTLLVYYCSYYRIKRENPPGRFEFSECLLAVAASTTAAAAAAAAAFAFSAAVFTGLS